MRKHRADDVFEQNVLSSPGKPLKLSETKSPCPNQGLFVLNTWTATTPCDWKIPDASLADKI